MNLPSMARAVFVPQKHFGGGRFHACCIYFCLACPLFIDHANHTKCVYLFQMRGARDKISNTIGIALSFLIILIARIYIMAKGFELLQIVEYIDHFRYCRTSCRIAFELFQRCGFCRVRGMANLLQMLP